MELCNAKMRKIMGAAFYVGYSLGAISLAGVAVLTKNWIIMHAIVASPGLLLIFYHWQANDYIKKL